MERARLTHPKNNNYHEMKKYKFIIRIALIRGQLNVDIIVQFIDYDFPIMSKRNIVWQKTLQVQFLNVKNYSPSKPG